jgi:hypothetical protein
VQGCAGARRAMSASWRVSVAPITSRCRSHNRVLPSMSVKRKVSVAPVTTDPRVLRLAEWAPVTSSPLCGSEPELSGDDDKTSCFGVPLATNRATRNRWLWGLHPLATPATTNVRAWHQECEVVLRGGRVHSTSRDRWSDQACRFGVDEQVRERFRLVNPAAPFDAPVVLTESTAQRSAHVAAAEGAPSPLSMPTRTSYRGSKRSAAPSDYVVTGCSMSCESLYQRHG